MNRPPSPPGGAADAVPAPPASLIAPPLPRRMACWLYEGVLMFGVVVPAGLLFSVISNMRHGLDNRRGLIAFLFVVLAAYFVWFWSKGQTLAMKTWRIRVVDRHGRRVRPLRAFMRYVFSYLWLLPPLAAFQTHRITVGPVMVVLIGWVAVWAILSRFHPERQFWHDALAGTRLIAAEDPPKRRS